MADLPESVEPAEDVVASLDIRGEMAETFDKIQERESADAPVNTAESPAAAPKPRDDGRDERGRFASKEPAVPSPTQGTDTISAGAPQSPGPPEDWPAEVKAHWQNLPPELQRFAAQRTAEVSQLVTNLGEQARNYEAITRAIPNLPAFIQTHGSLEIGLNRLMQAADWARRDPGGFARWLVGAANIDPRTLVAAPQQQLDPSIAPFAQKITSLEAQLAQIAQADRQRLERDIISQLDIFKKDHPHLDDLQDTMAEIINGYHAIGQVLPVEDAYSMAMARRPDVRAKADAAKQAASVAEDGKAKEAAAKARRIASTNVRSSGATVEPPPGNDWGSMRATMKQALVDSEARRARS